MLENSMIAQCKNRFDELLDQPLPHDMATESHPNTTNISAIDSEGHAAAFTFSHGEGNGYFLQETGIMMNNLMGEEDIHPNGFFSMPSGSRLSTMMSPTLIAGDDGTLTVMGTGGANRIRTAIMQTVSNLDDFGMSPQEAVESPRFHFEAGTLNAEIFAMREADQILESFGAKEIVRFDKHHLFFGGVHMVRREKDGEIHGAGDPRRCGTCITVE